MDRIYDIKLFLHHQTELAIKVSRDGEDEEAVWLPKSAIEFQMRTPTTIQVTAPETLLIEKGLV